MARCKNCGWVNSDELKNCVKCGVELSSPASKEQEKVNRDTISESEAFPDSGQNGRKCPNCGYPLRPGAAVCPNCQNAVNDETPKKNIMDNNNLNIKVNMKKNDTINPWSVPVVDKCKLEPIELDGAETPQTLVLKGDAHNLNRANLDPDNMTLTSKVQAELVCENGQWYIQDKSAQKTTFVYAGAKTAINDGDVIMMGNRRFVFHVDK